MLKKHRIMTGWENPRIIISSFWERAGQESPPAAECEVSKSSDQIEDLVGSRSPRTNQILTAKVISEELNTISCGFSFLSGERSRGGPGNLDLLLQLHFPALPALWCQALTCLPAYCRVDPHCLKGALTGTCKPVKYPGLSLCRL